MFESADQQTLCFTSIKIIFFTQCRAISHIFNSHFLLPRTIDQSPCKIPSISFPKTSPQSIEFSMFHFNQFHSFFLYLILFYISSCCFLFYVKNSFLYNNIIQFFFHLAVSRYLYESCCTENIFKTIFTFNLFCIKQKFVVLCLSLV